MARKNRNLQTIVQRWVQNGTASQSKYKDSINSLTDNPLDKAADASSSYLAGVARAEQMGTRAMGLRAYGFDNWKRKTSEVGSIRLGQGMQASQDRYSKSMATLLPFIDNLVESLPPRGDLNQNVARADRFMRGMADYKQRAR